MTMWMVRAGQGGDRAEDFLSKGVVALGDAELGALPLDITKQALLELYAKKYPEEKEGARAVWASQLVRLVHELQVGDAVITYDPERRVYPLGRITAGYEWLPGLVETKPHARRVAWTHEVPRGSIGVSSRNSLGAIQTLFRIPDEAAKELDSLKVPLGQADGKPPSPEVAKAKKAGATELKKLGEETMEKASGFIEDAISGLDPYELQDLVAGMLRAMGYRTRVSDKGADRGVDISASRDGLLLEEPRIFVEVKHRLGTSIDSKAIRSFLGGRKPGDRCLYVSTGGFTKDAHYEADRASVPITLINLSRLRELLLENYDQLDPGTRSMVPLRKVYWPVVEE